VGLAIDLEPAEPQDLALGLGAVRAAQHRPHPQGQLAHAERLDHVVVRADLEADDPIDLGVLGRAHHDRQLAGALVLAQPAAHLGAREVGQHQVQHDDVGAGIGQCRGQRRLPVWATVTW
jgi:hypothetical protein